MKARTVATVLLCWMPLLMASGHFNHVESHPVYVSEFCGNNVATADFTGDNVLWNSVWGCGASAIIAYSSSVEHGVVSFATRASTETAVPQRLTCFVGNGTGTGTMSLSLVVFEDGGDTTAETLGTINYDAATELDAIKTLTTFSTAASTAPYFYTVMATDGGSVSVANMDIICNVEWRIE